MPLPRIADLDLVYTYTKGENGKAELLFTSLKRDRALFNRAILEQIVNDPEYQRIMGTNTVIYPYETTPYPVLHASTCVEASVGQALETADKSWDVYMTQEGKPPAVVNLHDAYYQCKRPERLILGCAACLEAANSPDGCSLCTLANEILFAPTSVDPEDLTGTLKSRKSKIGNFTFISPVLTSLEYFSKTIRGISEHDFSCVADNAKRRETACKTRNRTNAVERIYCATCLIHKGCRAYSNSTYPSWCSEHYPMDADAAAQQILQLYPPAMPLAQMGELLYNSGVLNRRYAKKIAAATFVLGDYPNHRTPVFIIQARIGKRRLLTCDTYEQARDVLTEYNGAYHSLDREFTSLEYALLMEALQHTSSPRNHNGWHSTEYRVLYHTISRWRKNAITTNYTFNSRGQRVLPWTLTAESLSDYVRHYGHLSCNLTGKTTDLKQWQDQKLDRQT